LPRRGLQLRLVRRARPDLLPDTDPGRRARPDHDPRRPRGAGRGDPRLAARGLPRRGPRRLPRPADRSARRDSRLRSRRDLSQRRRRTSPSYLKRSSHRSSLEDGSVPRGEAAMARTNLAGRAGRWSAAHWRIAFFGWLAFVAIAVFLGNAVGANKLLDSE